MSSSLRWPDAALAGLSCAMRTFAGPATLAARGRIPGRPRIAVALAAVGELTMDKLPVATDRTDVPALAGRVAAGAYTGREVAGAPGAAVASGAAAVGTYATWRVRGLVVETTGLPDPVVAVAEDLLAYGLAVVSTRGGPDAGGTGADAESRPSDADRERRHGPAVLRSAGVGLVAGLAGTAAMTIAQGAGFALTGAEPSSAPADVADKIKRRAGRGRLKRRHRRPTNQAMHWIYGASWGIPYGVVFSAGDLAPELSGPVFGLFVWGASLAELPALGVADPPWKRSPASLASEALFHVVYGLGAGAAVRTLRQK